MGGRSVWCTGGVGPSARRCSGSAPHVRGPAPAQIPAPATADGSPMAAASGAGFRWLLAWAGVGRHRADYRHLQRPLAPRLGSTLDRNGSESPQYTGRRGPSHRLPGFRGRLARHRADSGRLVAVAAGLRAICECDDPVQSLPSAHAPSDVQRGATYDGIVSRIISARQTGRAQSAAEPVDPLSPDGPVYIPERSVCALGMGGMTAMRRRDLLGLFCLSLAVRLGVAALIPRPGYMDTAYYAAGAVRLAQSGGLSEPFLWNYLDDPTGIPHPGFLYWMPFPSLLAAPFAALFPGSFFALQLPFILLSALLPLVAYALAWEATGRRRTARLAGLLTLFSGFFFPYWTLPETFAPFAFFGSLALWLAGHRKLEAGSWKLVAGRWLLVGVLTGLAHLTRADGILLLPLVALAPLASSQSRNISSRACRGTQHATRFVICHLSFVILGYLLVMGHWFLRNLATIGSLLSPAGAKTLWLTNYDDLFCYR
nr:hypothetical protein [Anaerolineae bacterium]